jgi:anti-sigma factor RsiW
MPLLLTESLDPVQREQTHQHIERCPACGEEWVGYRETWRSLGDLPEVEVPATVKARFLASVEETAGQNVISFQRRPVLRRLTEAAAVVLLAGGAYYAGHRTAPVRLQSSQPTINSVAPYSLAE